MQVSTDDTRLSEIITGRVTRSFFVKYLACCMSGLGDQRVSHPKDARRLDKFICAASRFGGHVDTAKLESYLINDLEWTKQNAQYVRERIEIGLELLQVRRNFKH